MKINIKDIPPICTQVNLPGDETKRAARASWMMAWTSKKPQSLKETCPQLGIHLSRLLTTYVGPY